MGDKMSSNKYRYNYLRAVLSFVLLSLTGAADRLVEVTFDDGPDGSGPSMGDEFGFLNNLEDRFIHSTTPVSLTMHGLTHRSSLTEGRYGRAGVFYGVETNSNYVLVENFEHPDVFDLSVWLKPSRTTEISFIYHEENQWAIGLVAGQLVGFIQQGPSFLQVGTGLYILPDGEWHHLVLQYKRSEGTATVLVDFDQEANLSDIPDPIGTPGHIWVGLLYEGMMDELLILSGELNNNDSLDVVPSYCSYRDDFFCQEEIIFTPAVDIQSGESVALGYDVPIRFKVHFDPTVCSAMTPCVVVIDVGGGFTCSDDYDSELSLRALVEAGLFVIAADAFCLGIHPDRAPLVKLDEISQYRAVKDYILDEDVSPYHEFVVHDMYAASGCGHGADQVVLWTIEESDYPARSYSRSGAVGGQHCALNSGTMCPQDEEALEAGYELWSGLAYNNSDPEFQTFIKCVAEPAVDFSTIASTRDIALSWGAKRWFWQFSCDLSGRSECFEEGSGITYQNRWFRDMWKSNERTDSRTGYFIEGSDGAGLSGCGECASPSSIAFDCGMCVLKHGRAGMSVACPRCLGHIESRGNSRCTVDDDWLEPTCATE